MALGQRALGTTLSIGGTTPTPLAGLTSIGGLQLTAETIDATTLDSDGGYREFIGGFKDGGEIPLSGYFYGDESQSALYDLYEAGDASPFTITFPAALGASWDFDGVVTAYGTTAELESLVSFTATIKVSGKPDLTFAPATP